MLWFRDCQVFTLIVKKSIDIIWDSTIISSPNVYKLTMIGDYFSSTLKFNVDIAVKRIAFFLIVIQGATTHP